MRSAQWTPEREAEDYAKWIAALPARHRPLVRKWVDACSEDGRSEAWELATRSGKPVEAIADQLLRVARYSTKATTGPFLRCTQKIRSFGRERRARRERCSGRAVMRTDVGVLLCKDCVSPFDFVAVRSLESRRGPS